MIYNYLLPYIKIGMSQITDFFPLYPVLQESKYPLLNYYTQNFYQDLYNKKEFNELTIRDSDLKNSGSDEFQLKKYQKFINRFISYRTLNDAVLIFFHMGTGKTLAAISAIEEAIRDKTTPYNRAIIFTKGGGLEGNFKDEIVFSKYTQGRYIPEGYEELKRLRKVNTIAGRINKLVGANYSMEHFMTFAKNVIAKNSDENLINLYSNRILVFDEVHNLRVQPDDPESSEVYQNFYRFLHLVKGCKIILMSGTVMKDRPDEIAEIMNLILPDDPEKKMPTGAQFRQEFLESNGQLKNKEKLQSYFVGRVASLKSITSGTPREFVVSSKKDIGLKFFKVFTEKMDPFQAKYYKEALESDTDAWYSSVRQAASFVFPDGTYGTKGFQNHMTDPRLNKMKPDGPKRKREKGPPNMAKMTPKFREAIEGKTEEETLNNIEKHSISFANAIRDILKGGKVFVYTEFVQGSGAILFARLLELFGFSSARVGYSTPGRRYDIISGITTSNKQTISIVKKFNEPNNVRGEYFQVIIGSDVASEGFSLYDTEKIHILTPFWNYTPIEQTIARVFRLTSHDRLLKIKPDLKVKIYQHVPYAKKYKDSVYLRMYKASEDKDLLIKPIERLIHIMSVDCATNRLINMKGEDYSRECDYEKCKYKCYGISDMNPIEQDETTSNLFYSQEVQVKVQKEIKQIFQTAFKITYSNLVNELKRNGSYNDYIVLSSLKKLIDDNIPIPNKYGIINFLREDKDVYFLVDTLNNPSSHIVSYYTENPSLRTLKSFEDEIDQYTKDYMPEILDKLKRMKKDLDRSLLIQRLEQEVIELLIQNAIVAHERKIKDQYGLVEWIMKYFSSDIIRISGNRIALTYSDRIQCLTKNKWIDCTDDPDVIQEIKGQKKEKLQQFEDNPYGYYGIYNETIDKFWIRDMFAVREYMKENEDKKPEPVVEEKKSKRGRKSTKPKKEKKKDGRKKFPGQTCSTRKKDVLAVICFRLNIDLNKKVKHDIPRIRKILKEEKNITDAFDLDEMSDADLIRMYDIYNSPTSSVCGILKKWFIDNNLMEYTTLTKLTGVQKFAE